MTAQPLAQGQTSPFSQPVPPQTFAPRAPITLPHLLDYPASAGTRFAMHTRKRAPTDPARVALLLEVCGYDVRRRELVEMRGDSAWRAAPSAMATDPMLHFLRRVCDRGLPARAMDPNDERLDLVFETA